MEATGDCRDQWRLKGGMETKGDCGDHWRLWGPVETTGDCGDPIGTMETTEICRDQ